MQTKKQVNQILLTRKGGVHKKDHKFRKEQLRFKEYKQDLSDINQ